MSEAPTTGGDARSLPGIPMGPDDEPVFAAPWEARAFALVVQLHREGRFTWPQWAEQLGQEIRAAGADDDGRGYYLLWLSAAEKLLTANAVCDAGELGARKSALEAAQGGPAPA